MKEGREVYLLFYVHIYLFILFTRILTYPTGNDKNNTKLNRKEMKMIINVYKTHTKEKQLQSGIDNSTYDY